MADGTGIQWTDATWNPIRAKRLDGQPNKGGGGWSCQRVSPGCEHCYAETINKRLGTGLGYDAKGVAASDHYLDQKALLQPLRWKRGRRIFLSSMTDVFGDWVTDEQLDRMFAVMALAPQHTFQVLTKRAERMREYVGKTRIGVTAAMNQIMPQSPPRHWYHAPRGLTWPLPNVWLGVSAEDQARWDERVQHLLMTPAAVRFVSYEPALGPIEGEALLHDSDCVAQALSPAPLGFCICNEPREDHISWIIVGGESGPKARPFDIAWARSMVEQCRAAGVAVFVKQLGSNPVTACAVHDVSCGGHKWPWNENEAQARGKEPRPKLKSRHGSDMAEWPEALRVREFPR